MGKLRYYYGCMNSSKSSNLIMKNYQFKEANCKTLCLKPSSDTRQFGVIYSRAIKRQQECLTFDNDTNIKRLILDTLESNLSRDKFYIFVDEIHFASKEHIKQLWELSKYHNMDIFVYGLKVNYKNELFESVKTLEVLADTKEEIKSMCMRCSNKASTHIRLINGIPTTSGDECIVGDIKGEESYTSVCQECYHSLVL